MIFSVPAVTNAEVEAFRLDDGRPVEVITTLEVDIIALGTNVSLDEETLRTMAKEAAEACLVAA